MSKFYPEQHPLLHEVYSDEENPRCDSNSRFQRRFLSSSSGYVRTQVKGAAHIITRWPDHFSTFLTHWWITLGMIAILVFIIYNSIIAVAILPSPQTRPFRILNKQMNVPNMPQQNIEVRNIYMHAFVDSLEEFKKKDYLPYIETFSKKYTNYTYNLIVVIKDISNSANQDLSDELRNEMALNYLWDDKKSNEIRVNNKNTVIQVMSLRKYMDGSPIKKLWKYLPEYLLEFLTRCIAVWDKGGIAVNPLILTPKSPNPKYIEKLEEILSDPSLSINTNRFNKEIWESSERKVNNIQDIINNLDIEEHVVNVSENLLEAENALKPYVYINSNKEKGNAKSAKSSIRDRFGTVTNISEKNYVHKNKTDPLNKRMDKSEVYNNMNNKSYIHEDDANYINNEVTSNKVVQLTLTFPYPLNFKDNYNEDLKGEKKILKKSSTPPTDFIRYSEKLSSASSETKVIPATSEGTNVIFRRPVPLLTIDFYGNLIATATPCHAFLGTIFSNIIRHMNKKSVKDLIIKELSIFCKGKLSSCKGIDIILL